MTITTIHRDGPPEVHMTLSRDIDDDSQSLPWYVTVYGPDCCGNRTPREYRFRTMKSALERFPEFA